MLLSFFFFVHRHVGEFSKASSVAKELDHFLKTSPELSFERFVIHGAECGVEWIFSSRSGDLWRGLITFV